MPCLPNHRALPFLTMLDQRKQAGSDQIPNEIVPGINGPCVPSGLKHPVPEALVGPPSQPQGSRNRHPPQTDPDRRNLPLYASAVRMHRAAEDSIAPPPKWAILSYTSYRRWSCSEVPSVSALVLKVTTW